MSAGRAVPTKDKGPPFSMPPERTRLTDRYSLVARVTPMALVLLPALAGGAAWMLHASLLVQLGTLIGIPGALVIVLSHLGRDPGRNLQAALWQEWGGPPVIVRLRHRSALLDLHSRARLMGKFRLLSPPLVLPTSADERADPVAADRAYDAAQRYLILRTRDAAAFPLVFTENVNYGFRRNCLGLRWYGLGASLVGAGACLAAIIVATSTKAPTGPALWTYTAIATAGLGWWGLVVRRNWVRLPAEAYAARLLEAADEIEDEEFAR